MTNTKSTPFVKRFAVLVQKRGEGYVATVSGNRLVRTVIKERIGITPYDAACKAIELLHQQTKESLLPGLIIAPEEVLAHIPPSLRSTYPDRDTCDRLMSAAQQIETVLQEAHSLFKSDEQFCIAYRNLVAAITLYQGAQTNGQ